MDVLFDVVVVDPN